MNKFFLLFCVVSFSWPLWGQETKKPVVEGIRDSCRFYFNGRNYKKVVEYGEKIIQMYDSLSWDQDTLLASSYFYTGSGYIALGRNRKAMDYLNKSLAIRQIYFDSLSVPIALVSSNIAQAYARMGEYDKAIQIHEKNLPIFIQHRGEFHEDVASSYNNLANTYWRMQDYDLVERFHKKALAIRTRMYEEANSDIAGSYLNLGNLYKSIGDYGRSLEHYEAALEIQTRLSKKPDLNLARIYDNLAMLHGKMGEDKKCLDLMKLALEIRRSIWGEQHMAIASTNNNIGRRYHVGREYDLAFEYLSRGLEIQLALSMEKHPLTAMIYNNIGNYYLATHDVENALKYHELSLDIRKGIYGEFHTGVAGNYTGMSEAYALTENYQKAVEFQKRAISSGSAVSGPHHGAITSAYSYLADLYTRWEKFDSALQYNDIALLSLDTMKREYYSNNSVKLQLNERYSTFEQAITSQMAANKANPSQYGQKPAFAFAEKSKGNLLNQALKVADARSFSNVSPELIDDLKRVGKKIARLEVKSHLEKQKGQKGRDSLVNIYGTEILALKDTYELLDQRISSTYPEYYNLRYQTAVATVAQVQQELLASDQALLEYFVGDSNIYVFVVRSDTFVVHTLRNDFPLQDWVHQMREGIYGYHMLDALDEDTYIQSCDTYTEAAYNIYNKVLAPVKSLLPEKVIIVPDGALSYIPFEALLMELPAESHQFKSHAYFITDHQVSYSFSATFLLELRQKKNKASRGVLTLAPTFPKPKESLASLDARRNSLGPLAFSIPEVDFIHQLFGGRKLIGEAATEEAFRKQASKYRIIHLATHGKANDQVGDYSYLAFQPIEDTLENEFIYVRDLYNMELNADMVVLSACETGLGKLQRGEGVVSLGRGFAYAGAKSILTTLWSVSDEKTKDLMIGFYKNIEKRQAKDEALRLAKLAYMEGQNHLGAHPYYWAGMIAIGDMEPVALEPPWWQITALAGLGLGLVFLWWRWKTRRQR